jgi:hypothetical protein
MLLQKVPAYIDECARAAVIGEFVDKSFGLLDHSFEGC